MHLQIILRGINTRVELWKILAQGQFFKWIRKDLKTGKDVEVLFQLQLRPSVFGTWELIFPEECLATVLSMLGSKDGIYGLKCAGMKMALLRKMCGVKKIPKKYYKEAKKIPESLTIKDSWRGLHHLKVEGVAVHVIGYKKDVREIVEEWGYEQEML